MNCSNPIGQTKITNVFATDAVETEKEKKRYHIQNSKEGKETDSVELPVEMIKLIKEGYLQTIVDLFNTIYRI